ncbi:MAG TPA: hypothetical protein VGH28_26860 [Polyangiaceae bacterium]|jgi:hypothetical protein
MNPNAGSGPGQSWPHFQANNDTDAATAAQQIATLYQQGLYLCSVNTGSLIDNPNAPGTFKFVPAAAGTAIGNQVSSVAWSGF